MVETGELMKAHKHIFSIIIVSFLILSFSIGTPPVAGSIAPLPDQFIAEIFPNSTLPLQLTQTNTIISFNATDFPNKIGINFDANYTIYNSENTTTISVILPFSLAIDINDFMFDIYANNTQITYDIFNVSPWNENITEIDINFYIIEAYPITLIKSYITLLKNSNSVIRYRFNGSMNNPLDSRDLLYIIYTLGTSQEWIGNTTGRIELRIYGKQPILSMRNFAFQYDYVDISGGKSFSCEWDNIKIPFMDVGVKYYRETSPFEEFMKIWGFNLLIYIGIALIIIVVVIKRKKRKKIEI